jgi:hypothetical protein
MTPKRGGQSIEQNRTAAYPGQRKDQGEFVSRDVRLRREMVFHRPNSP